MSSKINSRGPPAFVQVDNRATHPNEAPLGRDRARLCLRSSSAFVPRRSDVFLRLARLPDAFWMLCSPECGVDLKKKKKGLSGLGFRRPPQTAAVCLPEHVYAPTHGFRVGHLTVEVSVVGRTAGKVTHGRGSGLTVTRAERPDGFGGCGGGGGPHRPKCCHSHVAAAPFVNCLCLPIGSTQKNCSTGKKNRRSFIFFPLLLLVCSSVCLV